MRDDERDAEVVREIAAAAFAVPLALDRRPTADRGAAWAARQDGRTRHLARTDPGGCWIVEDETAGPVGAVLSAKREGTWSLALLAVVPGAQGKEVGKALLARALHYGRACLRGIACAPNDPVAAHTLRRAGLTLHPTLRLSGPVDTAGLDPLDGAVHQGSAKHRELMDSVDRRTRGGAHGPDHEELLRHHALFVVDDLAGTGYCYSRQGRVAALAATSRRLATRLLTAALVATPPDGSARVTHVSAECQWAVDVAVSAGLRITSDGFLCLRGLRPPDLAIYAPALP